MFTRCCQGWRWSLKHAKLALNVSVSFTEFSFNAFGVMIAVFTSPRTKYVALYRPRTIITVYHITSLYTFGVKKDIA